MTIAEEAQDTQEEAEIVRAVRGGESHVPAARVRPLGELFWFVDRAAAGEDIV